MAGVLGNLQSVNARLAITLVLTVLFSGIAGVIGGSDDAKSTVTPANSRPTTQPTSRVPSTTSHSAPSTSAEPGLTDCLQRTAAAQLFVMVAAHAGSTVRVVGFAGDSEFCVAGEIYWLCFGSAAAKADEVVPAAIGSGGLSERETGRLLTRREDLKRCSTFADESSAIDAMTTDLRTRMNRLKPTTTTTTAKGGTSTTSPTPTSGATTTTIPALATLPSTTAGARSTPASRGQKP